MTDYNLNVIISKKSRNFNIVYDGLERYFLFFDDKEIASVTSDLTPEDLHSYTSGEKRIKPSDFDNLSDLEVDNTIKIILENINNHLDKEMTNFNKSVVFSDLTRSISDFYKSNNKMLMLGYFENAPANVKSKALELSELYDNENASSDEVYSFNENDLSIDEQVKERANPTLTKEEKEIASNIEKEIKEKGLINFLNGLLDKFHIGEHKNILRKTLMQFSIIRGKGSFLSETVAQAEAGKSFEDEIVFNIITPARYVYKLSEVTDASFIRYADQSPYYFNRQTILFGDFGSKKSFEKIEKVFNIFKELITEQEYIASKSVKGEKDWENKELRLEVESIGGAYSTIHNSFTEDDNQLISRTLNSTPSEVNNDEVLSLIFRSDTKPSKQNKQRAKAIAKLEEFGIYMLSLVNTDIEIINPYEDIFINYALQSENPKRELTQQLELFKAYCELTSYQCVTIGEYKIASIEQVTDYMNEINLENALIPYDSDFLKMLMAKGKKYELAIVRDIDYEEQIKSIKSKADLTNEEKEQIIAPIREEMAREDYISLVECENNALEMFNYDDVYSLADLNTKQKKELANKINTLYGIRGRSNKHIKRAFFKVKDLKYVHGRLNAYKNIPNVSQLLHSLHLKGYLGIYEHKLDGENLYYLTPKCEEILTRIEPTKTFEEYWEEHKANTGL